MDLPAKGNAPNTKDSFHNDGTQPATNNTETEDIGAGS